MPGSIRAMVVMVGWEWGYTAFSVLWAVTTVNYGGKRGELGSCPLPHCDQPSSLAVGGISFTFFVPKFQPKTFFSPKLFIWFLGGRFTYVYVHTHTSCIFVDLWTQQAHPDTPTDCRLTLKDVKWQFLKLLQDTLLGRSTLVHLLSHWVAGSYDVIFLI